MFVRFRNWLTATHKDMPFSIVYFEQVIGLSDRPGQGRQNQIYGGFKAVLLEWCENNGIAYSGVGVPEIKKFATGKGNAKKELMIAAAKDALLDEGSVLILSKKPNATFEDLDDNAAETPITFSAISRARSSNRKRCKLVSKFTGKQPCPTNTLESIETSSRGLCTSSDRRRSLFIGLILDCTDGIVTGTRDHFARAYNLSRDEVDLGFERLMSPDPESPSPAEDGRRLVEVEGTRNTFRSSTSPSINPALSKGGEEKPKIDPGVPRDHPDYQKIYQRMRRQLLREQAEAAKSAGDALEQDLRKLDGVNSATNVNKEKETKEKETINPPKPPKKERSRGPSKKALRCKGKPEFDERWGKFHELYPRRPDGKSVALAEAREILEMLVLEAGEDFDKILAGLGRYVANLKARSEEKYIKQSTTWLNNRCWEEEYTIVPESEIGRDLAAKKALENDGTEAGSRI